MKTTLRNLIITISFIFSFISESFNQEKANTSNLVSTENIRVNINAIKEKANQAYNFAQQANNASTVQEANTYAKQVLLLLEEAKRINKNAQIALDVLSTLENKNKCEKYINSVASDIVDLNNKIEYAINKTNNIIGNNDSDVIKHTANKIMTEIKKMGNIIPSTITSLELIDQKLISK